MHAEAIAKLFVGRPAVCVASPSMYEQGLLPQEAARIAKAAERRRREFTAGRNCARATLANLGAPEGPILSHADRSPIWPPGYVGSISHCDGFCCAVAGRSDDYASLGIDFERDEPLDSGLIPLVCRPDELAAMVQLGDPPFPTDWAKLVFVAKEAFYKAYHPITRTFLEFGDVDVAFRREAEGGWGSFRIGIRRPDKPLRDRQTEFIGRWRVHDGLVAAGVTLPAR